MNPLQRLHEAGQGIWLDFLRRGLITAGDLQRMIDEYALTGVTSNPSIFKKAIGGSTDYDGPLKEIVERGEYDQIDIFYKLALDDIRGAAELFDSVYKETDRKDGYVSFELDPRLAHDTAGSVAKAKELFEELSVPNVMIKVPGTSEGAAAVEELTAAGVNVNITLLFSISSYREVALAYIRGLERRLDLGESIDEIASVASFFVSRVDSAVDPLLAENSPLRGKIAVANAKLAYQEFLEIFSGPTWDRLAAAGAQVQRPLWASTGTKNPAYSDVLYVEELVGPDTVSTIPEQTMDAFMDHGEVRPKAVLEGVDEAAQALDQLAELDIDLDAVASGLEEEGIASFEKDLDSLLETIEEKVEKVRSGRIRWRSNLGDLEGEVNIQLKELGDQHVVGRIWRRDHTVWNPDPTEISNRMGWLTLPDTMDDQVAGLEVFAKQALADGFTDCVLLGMGGSSLAPEVLSHSFSATQGIDVRILDSTHPAAVRAVTEGLELEHTLFIVSSKSGTTLETLCHFQHFFDLAPRGNQFVAITDPGTPLAQIATDREFRKIFLNQSDIGGRYSALSLVGLVPGAILGVDLNELLDRAGEMACACHRCIPVEQNPGAWLGAVMGAAAANGRNKFTLVAPLEVSPLGDWVEQLIAESTGKEGRGIVPVVGEEVGPPDSYGQDRLFVSVGDVEGLDELAKAGHPVVQLAFRGSIDLGSEFFRWEFATAVAGHILGINPFDQPDVASAKQATVAILESGDSENPGLDAIEPLLSSLRPGDYVAIHAYLHRDHETEQKLKRVRLAIRDRYGVATTVGFGPRFLHSTGQLHKGGPNTGVFIQLVDDTNEDVPIPHADYTFRQLIDAQALADLRSLRRRERRIGRTTLDKLAELH